MKESLVSIIVPVYKVEKYINRCVDSLINQTYQNIEIILIDDGSPDDCGLICDEYAKKNKQIRTIHQKNMGLSASRNNGLAKALGKYIYFVDSDDYIEENTISILVEKIEDTKASIAVGGIKTVGDTYSSNNLWYKKDKVLNHDEAMQELLENKYMVSHACNKLFKKELIIKYPFPKGTLYEDLYIMHKVFDACDKVAITKEYLYNYYQREDSISNDHNLVNDMEYINAFKTRYEDLKDSKYEEICYYQLGYAIADVFLHNLFSKTDKVKYAEKIHEYLSFLKSPKLKKIMNKEQDKKKNRYINFVKIFKTKSRRVYLFLKRGKL